MRIDEGKMVVDRGRLLPMSKELNLSRKIFKYLAHENRAKSLGTRHAFNSSIIDNISY